MGRLGSQLLVRDVHIFCLGRIDTPRMNPKTSLSPAVESYLAHLAEKETFCQCDHEGVPTPTEVARLVQISRQVLFPGYFTQRRLPANRLDQYVERKVASFFRQVARLTASAFRHDAPPHTPAEVEGHRVASALVERLPDLKSLLDEDVRAAFDGDPAATSHEEIIYSYPGLYAVVVYRVAHELDRLGVPFIPRMMTEFAHSRTGIDIHPRARIGRSFFIDHGTGVVIGETTWIGDRVRIYQGVTLGALSLPRDAGPRFRGAKRHPTIEDDVIIYANTTILGGETMIGARSIIGGNNWIVESIPPDTRVRALHPELNFSKQPGILNP